MRGITWFSILQMRKQGNLNTKSRTTDSKTYSSHFKLLHLTYDILPLFRQWKKDSITIQYLFPLNMHFRESTAHRCPILPLIPYYRISTKSKPAPGLWGQSRLPATTRQPERTDPGQDEAWPCITRAHCPGTSGSSFCLPSSSFHKNYFRKLSTNSFKIFETPFENAIKQIYVKEPVTWGTISNFPRRTGKPSLTEFFPTWRTAWSLRTICSIIL